MSTSTKTSRKTSGNNSQNRNGLPSSTVQPRANLGGGPANALSYAAPDSLTADLTSQQTSETLGAGSDEIALRAYYLSEQRQREGRPGDEISDWLQAENELLGSTRST